MSGIRDFVSKDSRVDAFQKLRRDKKLKKKDLREIEKQLLKPDKLPDYTGPEPTAESIDKTSVKLVFLDGEEYKLFTKHFRVSSYIEKSCYHLDKLVAILRALEKGKIRYDEKKKKLTVVKRGDHPRKSKVGKRKQGDMRRTK